MKKYAYLARLEELLADMPAQERQDALRYYEEYFDAAGDDEATVAELGDPAGVARSILEGAGLPCGAESAAEAGETAEAFAAVPPAAPEPPTLAADAGPAPAVPLPAAPRGRFGKTGWILFLLVVGIAFLVQLAAVLTLLPRSQAVTETSVAVSSSVYAEASVCEVAEDNVSAFVAPEPPEAPAAPGFSSPSILRQDIDPLDKLEIELDAAEVHFEPAGHGEKTVTLAVENYERYGVEVTYAGGRCLVTMEDGPRLDPDEASPTVTVLVPDTGLGNVDIELGAGDVFLPDMAARSLDVEIGTGNVTVDGLLTCPSVSLEVGAGELYVREFLGAEVALECGAGSVVAERLRGARQIEAGTGSGDILLQVVGQPADYAFEGSAPLGEIIYNNTGYDSALSVGEGASGKMEVTSGAGDVTVSFLEE